MVRQRLVDGVPLTERLPLENMVWCPDREAAVREARSEAGFPEDMSEHPVCKPQFDTTKLRRHGARWSQDEPYDRYGPKRFGTRPRYKTPGMTAGRIVFDGFETILKAINEPIRRYKNRRGLWRRKYRETTEDERQQSLASHRTLPYLDEDDDINQQ